MISHTSTSPLVQRRNFIKKFCGGTFAAFSLTGFDSFPTDRMPAPAFNPTAEQNEQYWELIKKQFTVSPTLIMVNAANLCPAPYFIQDEVISQTKNIGYDVSFQHRDAYTQKREQALSVLAAFLGASSDELTITRNTSESNSFIVNGLDLKSGDEIILWDQNHPTNGIAWEHRSKRYGFSVKKITVPALPTSNEALVSIFAKSITSRTKLIAFSHISNTSGIALPAKDICALARAKGILTLVDGAQSFGMMDINLKEIGCDFYAASTHKWLMGPLENGILYIKKDKIERVWPTLIGAGWKDTHNSVDEKFATLGQRNETTLAALSAILEFHNSVGKKNVEVRVRELCSFLKERIKVKTPQVKFISPVSEKFSAGIVIVEVPGKTSKDIFQKLYSVHGIACASTGGIRFSPHIYNTLSDMDKIADALVSLSAS